MFKCVLFDLDGTLADTVESLAAAGNKALEMVGLMPRPIEDYKYFAGNGSDVLVKRILKAAKDEACVNYDKAYEAYRNFFEKGCTYHIKPYQGICEMLAELKKRKIKIGVVSNKPHQHSIEVVETLFGKGYFDCITGHKEGFPKKPDPASTIAAAGELGYSPRDCVYVGDTNVDMENGLAAGMFTVGVLWGFRTKEELERFKPQAIIKKPAELLELL